jgi:2-haloacid dehalogenase
MARSTTVTRLTGSKGIAAVVFDIGGVLMDWDPKHLFRKMFSDPSRMDWFLANVCTAEWNAHQDAGRTLADATAERARQFPEWEEEIRAYYGRWIEMIGGPVPGTAAIVEELSDKGFQLFALSNFSAETFAQVRGDYPVLDRFERIFLSAHYGCVKPDRRFFDIAIREIALPAETLVFIDDSVPNVATARSLGMHGIEFHSATDLRRDLQALGLLA